jgi:hypothetical protein
MGLDQYAGSREIMDSKFVWRKHAKLQKYMEDLWYEQHDGEFNCEYLVLSKVDIINLKDCIEKNQMPESEGGFFYGHQWQDESEKEYKEQDLEFCDWALKEIEQGKEVVYHCWY